MQEVLEHLKQHGEQLDSEIAAAIGMSVEKVRVAVSTLSARGDVTTCRSIRFDHGKQTEAILCRIAIYIPPASRGRKPKAQLEKK